MELHTIEETTMPLFYKVDAMQAFALNSVIKIRRCMKCDNFFHVNVKGLNFTCWKCLKKF